VKGNYLVYTDPNATLSGQETWNRKIKTDISLKTFVGRSSGEYIRIAFKGDGFVVVQPYEEVYFRARD
jgi:uncharacterized protein (AIM24 family)